LPERVVTRASSTACRMRERGVGSGDCDDAGAEARKIVAVVSRGSKTSENRGISIIPAAQTGEAETFLAGELKQFRTYCAA